MAVVWPWTVRKDDHVCDALPRAACRLVRCSRRRSFTQMILSRQATMRSHTGSLPPWRPSAAHVLVARQVYVVCLKVYTCERLFDAQEWSQFVHTDSSTAGFVLDFHAGRKLDFALGPSLSASASTVALNAPSEKRSPASPSPDIVDPDG